MNTKRFLGILDGLIVFLLVCIAVGTPLLFSSYTRSVFEVNKLLLLRVASILAGGIWLFRYLILKANGYENAPQESMSFLGIRWKKIGLEWPIMIWLGLNIISTLFSQNIRIALIGAYDRWEGIFTIFNYMFLWVLIAKSIRTKTHFHVFFWSIVIPTALSAGYGVFQSFGMDFMNWSVDPTKRVFACINNPVHFCAYLGMVVPLGLGWLLYRSSKEAATTIGGRLSHAIKWAVFAMTILIYYTQFLSFSRAAWIGFIATMTLFYLLVTGTLDDRSKRHFLVDFFVSALAIGSYYILYIFGLSEKLPVFVIFNLVLVGYMAYSYFIFKTESPIRFKWLYVIGVPLATFFLLILDVEAYLKAFHYPILLAVLALLIFVSHQAKDYIRPYLSRMVIILIFAKLQFVTLSLTSIAVYLVLLYTYYRLILKGNSLLLKEKKFWLIAFLFIFGFVLFAPTLPDNVSKLFGNTKEEESLLAVRHAQKRVNSYRSDALKGTARNSMWKSAVPWVKDYWLIGSGPDTVKFMYPDYRRPDYGRLEGGHNYTPDRLHNEYINTMVTRGIPATLVYYGGLILGWYILILTGIFNLKKNPNSYLAIGILASAGVYLGQVLFNFGVVATLVLFYMVAGLGHALVTQDRFKEDVL